MEDHRAKQNDIENRSGIKNGNIGNNRGAEIDNRRENNMLELSKDLKKITPPKFDGKQIAEGAENWLNEMENYFELRDFSKATKALWGSYKLIGEAASWWLPQVFFVEKVTKFHNLRQGSLIVQQYWDKFVKLLNYVPMYKKDEKGQANKFILGINTNIEAKVDMHGPENKNDVLEKSLK
ncbi:uncharacterized protein LOC131858962 [Cryptomeria japonica]|uniref:uncharacterized protein LOC131858962 n=1 Tax=Cryptomeria japonica TaxID=3369 RepID=UPI0027DA3E5E|nr:uncharacterized protein LOC131858962 [Cryptomeria japonica]